MKLTAICATLVATCSLALTSASYGQEIKPHTLRFAHQNSAQHPQGQGVLKFIELVKQKSGGKIDVRDFPGGTLGGDIANVSSLQGGTLDLIVLNAGLLVGVSKEFAVVDLPFMFNDPKEADAIVDGPIGKKLFDLLPPKGLVGLAYWELGFRNVTNSKRPLAKLEDFSGLKLRVLQSPLFIDTFTALGANPVPMPFPEVYTALEQKVVDGQENPITVIVDSKFQEVQKYLSLTKHIYNPQAVIMSKKKLGQAQRRGAEDHPGRRQGGDRLSAAGVEKGERRGARCAEESGHAGERHRPGGAREDPGEDQARHRQVFGADWRAVGEGHERGAREDARQVGGLHAQGQDRGGRRRTDRAPAHRGDAEISDGRALGHRRSGTEGP